MRLNDSLVVICGASDDLVELDGVIREEFCSYKPEWFRLASDFNGRELRFRAEFYDLWEFKYEIVSGEWDILSVAEDSVLIIARCDPDESFEAWRENEE